MDEYIKIQNNLKINPKVWLVTGVAGFIGSNLLEKLLKLNQFVVGIDNFSTGKKINLEDVKKQVQKNEWENFKLIEGDICDIEICKRASNGVNYILHQAALGSVPKSIDEPLKYNLNNVNGFLNILTATKEAKVEKLVYASSSSVYGNNEKLPKIENKIGKQLSPYAITKYVNEIYAELYADLYQVSSVGLRYFNVFGPRQDPNGNYAAVIPKWIFAIINGETITINGDGETSRDFCHVDNVVQMNILAATSKKNEKKHEIYNVSIGGRTSLNDLYILISTEIEKKYKTNKINLRYEKFRVGDVRHSQARINKANDELNYIPTVNVKDGLVRVIDWYINELLNKR
jgi:UDP-N-acetylglucosamine 4-epimerase